LFKSKINTLNDKIQIFANYIIINIKYLKEMLSKAHQEVFSISVVELILDFLITALNFQVKCV
jgi:hypothetical protein